MTTIVENRISLFVRIRILFTKKKSDFSKFRQLAELIRQGRHHRREGVEEIVKIRREMNDGGKRRYSDEEILGRLKNPQRPYAGPVEESHGMIWSDLHGDMQSATEMSAPPPNGGQ